MGARPDQQLALNFLAAVHELWVKNPGTYTVEESLDDLVPALAQMCIKALASDIRDSTFTAHMQSIPISGALMKGSQVLKGYNNQQQLTLRDALNKIIHGLPTLVEVCDEEVRLHFRNSSATDSWTDVWFSGTQLLKQLDSVLYKHRTDNAEMRERQIEQFLAGLGVRSVLPKRI
jgi:hypothetical protein